MTYEEKFKVLEQQLLETVDAHEWTDFGTRAYELVLDDTKVRIDANTISLINIFGEYLDTVRTETPRLFEAVRFKVENVSETLDKILAYLEESK